MQVDLDAIAGEGLATSGCDEVVVLFSVIVVTFVLCDEICVVVLALMSKPKPESESNKVNHQRDPVLERGPQTGNHIMILSHENVLAHTMALATPHARQSQSLARLLSPYQCQDALKCWMATSKIECWEVKDDCLDMRHEGWASEVMVQDKCQFWQIKNGTPRSWNTKPKEISPADIMARWNLT